MLRVLRSVAEIEHYHSSTVSPPAPKRASERPEPDRRRQPEEDSGDDEHHQPQSGSPAQPPGVTDRSEARADQEQRGGWGRARRVRLGGVMNLLGRIDSVASKAFMDYTTSQPSEG